MFLSVRPEKRLGESGRGNGPKICVRFRMRPRKLRYKRLRRFMQIREIRLPTVGTGVKRQFIRNGIPIAVKLGRILKPPPYCCALCPWVAIFPRLKNQLGPSHIINQVPNRIFKRPPFWAAHGNYPKTWHNDGQANIKMSFTIFSLTIQHAKFRARRCCKYPVNAIWRLISHHVLLRQRHQPHIVSGLFVWAAPCAGANHRISPKLFYWNYRGSFNHPLYIDQCCV